MCTRYTAFLLVPLLPYLYQVGVRCTVYGERFSEQVHGHPRDSYFGSKVSTSLRRIYSNTVGKNFRKILYFHLKKKKILIFFLKIVMFLNASFNSIDLCFVDANKWFIVMPLEKFVVERLHLIIIIIVKFYFINFGFWLDIVQLLYIIKQKKILKKCVKCV